MWSQISRIGKLTENSKDSILLLIIVVVTQLLEEKLGAA